MRVSAGTLNHPCASVLPAAGSAPPTSVTPGGTVLPDLLVLWVIALVLLLTVILQQLFFKPLLRVMHAREEAVRSARALADRDDRFCT